jgi:hypothetical protein
MVRRSRRILLLAAFLRTVFEARTDYGEEVRFRDRFGKIIICTKVHAGTDVGLLRLSR